LYFASPWDRTLRLSTALVGLVTAAVVAFVLVSVWPSLSEGASPGILAAAVLPLILVLVFALAPRGFRIAGGRLVVERLVLPVEIDLGGVRAVARLPEGALRGAIRLAGASGFCGYYGRYRSPTLGSFRLYATRTKDLVCLDTVRGRFILSPEPPDRFLEAVLARAPRAASVEQAELLRARPAGPSRWLLPAVGVLGALGIAAAVFAVSWGMAPVRVGIEGDFVRVERRWAGPIDIPISSVHSAAPLTPEQRRGWVRTAGTALGPVAYGRFRGPALGSFRLYAWRRGGAVLLDTDEGRVVVTVEDPRTFVEEIEARVRARGY